MLLDDEARHHRIESLNGKDLFTITDIKSDIEHIVLDKTFTGKEKDARWIGPMWDDTDSIPLIVWWKQNSILLETYRCHMM